MAHDRRAAGILTPAFHTWFIELFLLFPKAPDCKRISFGWHRLAAAAYRCASGTRGRLGGDFRHQILFWLRQLWSWQIRPNWNHPALALALADFGR